MIAAVQVRRLADLLGDAHVGLPQEEHAEGADNAGEDQGENGVGKPHFGHHLILGDNKDLRGQGHLHQHDAEEQLLAPELQHGEGVARHGAEGHGADHPEEDHQPGVDVQLEEGQTLDRVLKVVPHDLMGEEGRGYRHALRNGFGAGEDHPNKGKDHEEGADDQRGVGEDGHPLLGGL